MTLHLFHVGQRVRFQPGAGDLRGLGGNYTVVRQLPSETRDLQYRIKHDQDGHERVVLESQLAPSAALRGAADPWRAKSGNS
jgi:hypothetical protein